MHGSLNVLAQCISKIVVRSSLQTETSVPSKDASSEPLPPTSYGVPRSRDGAPIAPLPVAGTFSDLCEKEVPSRDDLLNNSAKTTKRKPTEMPLSSHPPSRKSWIEVQPFQTHNYRQNVHLRAEIQNSNSTALSLKQAVARKESPEAMTSRPYHGTIPPPPPPIPDIRQLRRKSQNKPSIVLSQDTIPTTLCEQPIAPLTPRHRPVRLPCLSGSGSIQARCNPAERNNGRNERSPVGNSLQLEIFSELDVEFNEAMNLYTAREIPGLDAEIGHKSVFCCAVPK